MFGVDIGAGPFEFVGHFIYRYDGRVVGYRVDFTKPAEPAGHAFYAGLPFQGSFANIVSVDIEYSFFKLGLRGGSHCRYRGQDRADDYSR